MLYLVIFDVSYIMFILLKFSLLSCLSSNRYIFVHFFYAELRNKKLTDTTPLYYMFLLPLSQTSMEFNNEPAQLASYFASHKPVHHIHNKGGHGGGDGGGGNGAPNLEISQNTKIRPKVNKMRWRE